MGLCDRGRGRPDPLLRPVLDERGLPPARRRLQPHGQPFQRHSRQALYARRFIVSGAIAGLGGGAELLGTQFRLINGYGAGYGFDGVAMALIGQLHPIATMVVALFFAVLRVGSTTMQAATGVPTSVSDIIQALVIVFSVAGMALTKLPEFQAWRSRVFHGRKAGEA